MKCDARLPDFIIAGAQKSASTFIQNAISRHPDVYMPKGETRFFEDPEFGDGDLRRLASLFDGRTERLLGIKRPDYLGRPEVPSRISRSLPGARIIVVLRNPVDRLISAYYYYIKLGLLPAVDINDALPGLLSDHANNRGRADELLSFGMYATHLKRYREFVPDSQMCIIFQEDVKQTPANTVGRVCEFLGLDPALIPALPAPANTGLYPMTRLRFLRLRNRFLYDYDPVSGKLQEKKMRLRRLIPAATITLVDRWILARMIDNRRPALDSSVRSSLIRYYRGEIDQVAEITGRNLDNWG